MTSGMRIGTWNLDGRWSLAHQAFMQEQMCDVWLLTEVPGDISLQGYTQHLSQEIMLEESIGLAFSRYSHSAWSRLGTHTRQLQPPLSVTQHS